MLALTSPNSAATTPSSPRARLARRRVAESLGDLLRLLPGLLRRRGIEVLVRLALHEEHSQPQSIVLANERVIEELGKLLGDVRHRQPRQLRPQAPHLRVESLRLLASGLEQLLRLDEERLGAGPELHPREPVGFLEQLVRVGGLGEPPGKQRAEGTPTRNAARRDEGADDAIARTP